MATIENNDNDEAEQIDTSQPQSAIRNSSTNPNKIDPSQLFEQAKQSLDKAQNSGVTADQLNALSQHQGNNSILNMFMQLVGAAGRVNPKPYQDTLNSTTNQEAQRLALQNQLSQQNLGRAQASEQLGTSALGAQQKELQLATATAPATNIDKATILSFYKNAGMEPPDISNMTHAQAADAIASAKSLGQQGVEQQRNEAMKGVYGGRALKPVNLPGGQKGFYDSINHTTQDAYGNIIPNPQGSPSSDSVTNVDISKPVDANYVINNDQQQNHAKILNLAQKDFQKNYSIPDTTMQNTLSTIDKLVELSQQGNYKAANSLAAQTARMFEGLGGQRITNQMISMENDPTSSGLINRAVQLIQGAAGEGKVTPQDAKNMSQVSHALRDIHNKTLSDVTQQYNTRISQAIGKPFEDNKFWLGHDLSSPTETNQPVQSGLPENHINFDDYLKSRQ